MLGSKTKEGTTSVKHVFIKNYHQSSFELLEITKCLKLIWLGAAGMQFENTTIDTLETESHVTN